MFPISGKDGTYPFRGGLRITSTFPLGGNRKGKFRTIVNLMITMLIGGLWHGADLRFIIWGGFHGLGLAVNKIKVFHFRREDPYKQGFKGICSFSDISVRKLLLDLFQGSGYAQCRTDPQADIPGFPPRIVRSTVPGLQRCICSDGRRIHNTFPSGEIQGILPWIIYQDSPRVADSCWCLMTGFLLFQMRTTEIMPFIYFRF